MTKADIVKNISDKTGMDKSDVQMITEKLMSEIKNSLKNNENVYLRGFGSFSLRYRRPRIGRNPKSGIKVQINERYVPHFKPGKELRDRVNHSMLAEQQVL